MVGRAAADEGPTSLIAPGVAWLEPTLHDEGCRVMGWVVSGWRDAVEVISIRLSIALGPTWTVPH